MINLVSDGTFVLRCSCGGDAGTFVVHQEMVEYHALFAGPWMTADETGELRAALRQRDRLRLFEVVKLAKWANMKAGAIPSEKTGLMIDGLCNECGQVYCRTHWSDVIDIGGEGWHVMAKCPKGHTSNRFRYR